MDSLLNSGNFGGEDEVGLVVQLEAWASEVLLSRDDALGHNDDKGGLDRCLDHFVGVVVARDRLQRVVGSSNLVLLAAVDALFISFTEEVRHDWVRVTGMEDLGGDSWWWTRLPTSGPVREEFDVLVDNGVFGRLDEDGDAT